MKPSKNRTIRTVIVDDEPLARAFLKEQLSALEQIEIVAECQNGFEAIKVASECKPDLMFLDIQMPKLDGFDVCELIDPHIAVVFVTAYDQYAVKAFEVHAVDYLLKPFVFERLEESVERVKKRLGRVRVLPPTFAFAARPDLKPSRIVVKSGSNIVFVPLAQLDYVKAQGDYLALHSQGKSVFKNQSISSLEKQLDPSRFVRIHRSIIVNLDRISQVHPYSKDDKIAVLKDGTKLPISRTGYQRLKKLWGSWADNNSEKSFE